MVLLLLIICIIELLVILWLRIGKTKRWKIEETINFFRQIWGTFVIYVLATSIIGLFIASFILKEEISLTKMNEWVSLVLGLIALFVGIISLFLSFYNIDQSIQSQKQSMDIMENVKSDIQDTIQRLESKMQKEFSDLHKEVTEYKKDSHETISARKFRNGDWGEF